MNDKLQTNVDHFDNENICIVYVISRLEGDAAEHIFAWCHHDASHFYISIYKLFEHLKEIYDELNRNRKCRREYNALRQTDKSFNVFYFDFMKLFSYLDYDDCTLMNDLQNKINKLRMHSGSKDLTIFIIFFNSYKYHVMLFKLINESTFYQHYMNDVLFEYLHQFCQIYLNDIIIYSKILKKHKRHVRLILNRLREADLQIDIDKCKFHVQKIIFLELLISIEELKINSRKMQAVVDWSTLNNLTQMQFFIDFCNFYRCFIKNFSKIVRSMIQLTQKKIIFEWNEVCQIAFDHMKRRMIETSILRHFDQTRETILEIDSFDYVNDEVLSQYNDEEVLHSIVFYSKNMSSAECNYEIYDKELLIIIRAFEHWWLELKLTDIFIKMFIDHQALISLMKDKELSRRQMRWVQKLADFNFKIMYWSDKQNIKIDALTRQADVVLRDSEDECVRY